MPNLRKVPSTSQQGRPSGRDAGRVASHSRSALRHRVVVSYWGSARFVLCSLTRTSAQGLAPPTFRKTFLSSSQSR